MYWINVQPLTMPKKSKKIKKSKSVIKNDVNDMQEL